jgi:hypothetical protein
MPKYNLKFGSKCNDYKKNGIYEGFYDSDCSLGFWSFVVIGSCVATVYVPNDNRGFENAVETWVRTWKREANYVTVETPNLNSIVIFIRVPQQQNMGAVV